MAMLNYCSTVLWEIVTILINSPYGKKLISCPVARSSIKANFWKKEICLSEYLF